MPIVTLHKTTLKAESLSKSTGVWTPVGTTEWIVSDETIDKPLKTSRPKPKDLFASSTARKVRHVDRSFGIGVRDTWLGNPSAGQVIRAPMTEKVGNATGAAIPLPNFAKLDGLLRQRIKDQNLNLAQSLAEYHQTAGLFTSAVKDIAGTIRNIRSGRAGAKLFEALRQPPNQMSKNVANRWLQLQYGWKPLMSDIYGSAEALAKVISEGKFLYETAYDDQEVRLKDDSSVFYSMSGTLKYRLKGKARYKVSSAGIKQLSEVGITNPALLAWEVIPYSFVVDWFVPVGNWLSSLDALVGTSSLTVNRSYKATLTLMYNGKSGNNAYNVLAPVGRHEETVTERLAPNNSLQLPKLAWEPSLSYTKILNAMALLRQIR